MRCACAVCRGLKLVAQLGVTVITVLHQPRYSVYTSFDQVLLLAPAHELAYCGPPELACPYFEAAGFRKPVRRSCGAGQE